LAGLSPGRYLLIAWNVFAWYPAGFRARATVWEALLVLGVADEIKRTTGEYPRSTRELVQLCGNISKDSVPHWEDEWKYGSPQDAWGHELDLEIVDGRPVVKSLGRYSRWSHDDIIVSHEKTVKPLRLTFWEYMRSPYSLGIARMVMTCMAGTTVLALVLAARRWSRKVTSPNVLQRVLTGSMTCTLVIGSAFIALLAAVTFLNALFPRP